MKQYSKLFCDTNFCGLELNNRVTVAPMTRTSASFDGIVTDQMKDYYASFAKGGFSLLITEGTYTDLSYSQGYNNQPGIANEKQKDGWIQLVDAVHQYGAKIIIQLMHAGALTQGNRFRDETIAPSAVKPKGEQLTIYGGEGQYPMPREITRLEMKQVMDEFVESAVRAKEVGFDGIELHGANGYLLDGFITKYTNQRTDEYGGSAENRVRFQSEIIHKIKEAVGRDFPVGIRISQGKVNDGRHKWSNGPHDAPIIFKSLAKAGANFIHITEYDCTQPAFGEGPTLTHYAKTYSKLPVITNGGIYDPNTAEMSLNSGEADLVALGKAALANMDWVQKAVSGESLKEFDFNMLQPFATLDNAEKWRGKVNQTKPKFRFVNKVLKK